MHIMLEDLPFLERAFREKYGREIIGSNLGQFHSEYVSDDGRDDVEYSLHSIFLMKKYTTINYFCSMEQFHTCPEEKV